MGCDPKLERDISDLFGDDAGLLDQDTTLQTLLPEELQSDSETTLAPADLPDEEISDLMLQAVRKYLKFLATHPMVLDSPPVGGTDVAVASGRGSSVFAVNDGLVDLSFGRGIVDISDLNSFPDVSDRLRGKTGKYWTQKTRTRSRYTFFEDITEFQNQLPILLKFDTDGLPDLLEISDKIGRYNEWFLVLGRKFHFGDRSYGEMIDPGYAKERTRHRFLPQKYNAWLVGGSYDKKRYLPLMKTDVWLYDHAYNFIRPNQLQVPAAGVEMAYAEIRGNYNFYEKKYEQYHTNVDERLLPNMYAIMTVQNTGTDNFWAQQMATFDGRIKSGVLHRVVATNTMVNNPFSDFFSQLGLEYRGRKAQTISEGLIDRSKNIVLSNELIFGETKEHMFPMNAEVEFSTDPLTEFSGILQSTGIDQFFMKSVIESKKETEVFDEFSVGSQKTESKFVIDVRDWLLDLELLQKTSVGDVFGGLQVENGIFLDTSSVADSISDHQQYDLWRQLLITIFLGKTKQFVEKHQRTLEEMMEGDLAYAETVLYRIAKYEEGQLVPMQNFYFLNSADFDVAKYFDTQVHYGKKYNYRIYAYNLVVGTQYKYLNVISDPTFGKYAAVRATHLPSLWLIEEPLFEKEITVMDKPPVMPDVEFIPFRGMGKKIKLNITNQHDAFERQPQIIERYERDMILRYRLAQGLDSDSPISYRTDDLSMYFDVYRIDTLPSSYLDFAGKKIARVSTDAGFTVPINAESVSYIDEIETNKKYYYVFRSVDVHGHTSYPSPVYQFQMYDVGGAKYPEVRLVEFGVEEPRQPTKPMRKYIHIKPAFAQTILRSKFSNYDNLEDAVNGGDVEFETEEEQLWGKRFKIRLTSKQTGRQIDINVIFGKSYDFEG